MSLLAIVAVAIVIALSLVPWLSVQNPTPEHVARTFLEAVEAKDWEATATCLSTSSLIQWNERNLHILQLTEQAIPPGTSQATIHRTTTVGLRSASGPLVGERDEAFFAAFYQGREFRFPALKIEVESFRLDEECGGVLTIAGRDIRRIRFVKEGREWRIEAAPIEHLQVEPQRSPTFEEKVDYVVHRNLSFASTEGTARYLDAFLPKSRRATSAVLIFPAGGWHTHARGGASAIATALANSGIASFVVYYRLAPQHPFPAQLDDGLAALRWLRDNSERYNVDGSRVGVTGIEVGGQLAALIAARSSKLDANSPELVQAAVIADAPTDLREWPPESTQLSFWLGGSPKQSPGPYVRASPATFARPNMPPLAFIQATAEQELPDGGQLYQQLKEWKVPTDRFVGREVVSPGAISAGGIRFLRRWFSRYLN